MHSRKAFCSQGILFIYFILFYLFIFYFPGVQITDTDITTLLWYRSFYEVL